MAFKIILVACLVGLACSRPSWLQDEETKNGLLGAYVGADSDGRIKTNGWVRPNQGGHDVYGDVQGFGEGKLLGGGTLLGVNADGELGAKGQGKVYGAAGHGDDARGHYYRAGVGGDTNGTLYARGSLGKGALGVQGEAKLTGGVDGDAGAQIHRTKEGGITGEGEVRGGARVGTGFSLSRLIGRELDDSVPIEETRA